MDAGEGTPAEIADACPSKDPTSAANAVEGVAPCVLDVQIKGKSVTMTVLLKPGDLKGRG